MNLHDFVVKEKNVLDQFYAWWWEEHRKDPEIFPVEMNESDWFESLIIYSEDK